MMNDLKTIYVDVVFFTDCSSEVGFVKSRKILKHLWLQNTRVGFVCLLFVFFSFVVLSEIYKNTFEMISRSIYYGEKQILQGPFWALWKSVLA